MRNPLRRRKDTPAPELARRTTEKRERHVLGGRAFLVVQEGTVEQELEFAALIKLAGLDNVIMEEGETTDALALRLFSAAIENRTVFRMIGALLVPEELVNTRDGDPGDDWSTEIGEQTADFVRRLTDPRDKAHVKSLVMSLLIPFVRRGISSIWITPRSPNESIQDHQADPSRPNDMAA